MNSVPNSGPEAPPTFITRCMPAASERVRQGLGRKAVDIRQNGLEAALHVGAVIAVADRLVERGQLVRMIDDRPGDGLDEGPAARLVKLHGGPQIWWRRASSCASKAAAFGVEIERVDELDA